MGIQNILVLIMSYGTAVHHALSRLDPRTPMQIWDVNPWLRNVLGGEEPGDNMFTRPTLPPVVNDTEPYSHNLMDVFPDVAMEKLKQARCNRSRLRSLNVVVQTEDEERDLLLQRWLIVIDHNLSASATGEQIAAILDSGDDTAQISKSVLKLLQDTFGTKATGTLKTRLSPLLRYINWVRNNKSTLATPIEEDVLYEYISVGLDPIAGTAAPTAANSLLEALNFSAGTIGLNGAMEAASSVRIVGAASRHFIKKLPTSSQTRLRTQCCLPLKP